MKGYVDHQSIPIEVHRISNTAGGLKLLEKGCVLFSNDRQSRSLIEVREKRDVGNHLLQRDVVEVGITAKMDNVDMKMPKRGLIMEIHSDLTLLQSVFFLDNDGHFITNVLKKWQVVCG